MSSRTFKQVDVFTNKKYKGNPVAVFFDADDLTSEEMQAIATWTNLAETTFVLKPTSEDADYRLRIFTPDEEFPFAGHPTLGSCFALIESGLIKPVNGKIVQECKAGLVEITVEGDDVSNLTLTFKLPYYYLTEIPNSLVLEVEKVLGLPQGSAISTPILVEDGPKWLVVQLANGDDVLNLIPDSSYFLELTGANGWSGIGVFGKYDNGSYELRNLYSSSSLVEDPACGSGAAAVGAYLGAYLKENINSIDINQGKKVGRDAKLRVSLTNKDNSLNVYVSGQAVTCINGTY